MLNHCRWNASRFRLTVTCARKIINGCDLSYKFTARTHQHQVTKITARDHWNVTKLCIICNAEMNTQAFYRHRVREKRVEKIKSRHGYFVNCIILLNLRIGFRWKYFFFIAVPQVWNKSFCWLLSMIPSVNRYMKRSVFIWSVATLMFSM